jgi:serine protease Do
LPLAREEIQSAGHDKSIEQISRLISAEDRRWHMRLRSGLLLGVLAISTLWTRSDGGQLRDVFRRVERAVVIVRTEQRELAPFPQKGMVSQDGLGSGVLISSDGKVLTAAHLVQAADKAEVEFPNGDVIPAHVIGSVTKADVALLQLDRVPKGIAPVPLGDSDKAEIGDQVFVIGAPYGIGHTLTAGHMSGRHERNKKTENSPAVEFLQTDAAVNGGNSGSPLFSMNGEVVGIVTSILSKSGGSEGLAFAAASNTAKGFLLERKSFWSGIDGLFVTDSLAKALNLPQPAGLLVQHVAEESVAWNLGINPGALRARVEGTELVLGGDIILSVNGIEVVDGDVSLDDIYESWSNLKPGEGVVVRVLRAGQVVFLSAAIAP